MRKSFLQFYSAYNLHLHATVRICNGSEKGEKTRRDRKFDLAGYFHSNRREIRRLDRESVNVITEIARISENRKVYLSPGAINLHAQHVPHS